MLTPKKANPRASVMASPYSSTSFPSSSKPLRWALLLESAYIKIKSHPDLSRISSTCFNLCDTLRPATASPTTWLCHNWASGHFSKCSRTWCLHTGQSSLTCRSSPAYLPLSFPPKICSSVVWAHGEACLCRGRCCLSRFLFPHGCLLLGLAPTLSAAILIRPTPLVLFSASVFFPNFYPLPFPLTPNHT